MHYEITFTKAMDTTPGPRVERHNGMAQVREFLARCREYPGSQEIISVEKVTAKGRTAVPF